jgi:hypothetical protein
MEKVGIFLCNVVYYMAIGNLLAIWYIFSRFGILCQEKSGNTAPIYVNEEDFKSTLKVLRQMFG